MDSLSLIDVSKPEKIKEVLNELITYKNNAKEIPEINKTTLGLGNVNNTSDDNKPVSTPQKTYIDNENKKDVKLVSENSQLIESDITIGQGKKISLERADETKNDALKITQENGTETLDIGSKNIPLKIKHSMTDINKVTHHKNPEIEITDKEGNVIKDNIALLSDTEGKVSENVFKDAEVENGVVTDVDMNSFTNITYDEMSIRVVHRSIATGKVVKETEIPLKLASIDTRGLMSKEDALTLKKLVLQVAALEGKASRYVYSAGASPTAAQIESFVQELGREAPYTGVAVVVAETYHVWHYYENDGVGWRDDGADTVTQATNSSLGVVIGSTDNGKIYIESDGTMSLIGYDELVSLVTNLQNNSASQSDVQSMIDAAVNDAIGGSY